MLYAKLIGRIALFTCENIAHIEFCTELNAGQMPGDCPEGRAVLEFTGTLRLRLRLRFSMFTRTTKTATPIPSSVSPSSNPIELNRPLCS